MPRLILESMLNNKGSFLGDGNTGRKLHQCLEILTKYLIEYHMINKIALFFSCLEVIEMKWRYKVANIYIKFFKQYSNEIHNNVR
jgi:hypothetical protein